MKHSDKTLQRFGTMLSDMRQRACVTTDELAAEIGASKHVYDYV